MRGLGEIGVEKEISMFASRLASTLVAATALSLGTLGSEAWAADLKVKAPPPPPVEQLDIHGFADVTFLNDYITPRGLLVNNTGSTTQILTRLVLHVYKDKMGVLNDVSFTRGLWDDPWSHQHQPPRAPCL